MMRSLALARDPGRSPPQSLLPTSAKQACQACQQRKRKVGPPPLPGLELREVALTYSAIGSNHDVACARSARLTASSTSKATQRAYLLLNHHAVGSITDARLLADALLALEEREARVKALEWRVAALEGIIRSVPDLAHLASRPTEELSSPPSIDADFGACSISSNDRDLGSERLPLELVEMIEGRLASLHHPQPISITNTMHIHLGGAAEDEETNHWPPAEWPTRERGEVLVDTYISMNPLYLHYWQDDMRRE